MDHVFYKTEDEALLIITQTKMTKQQTASNQVWQNT